MERFFPSFDIGKPSHRRELCRPLFFFCFFLFFIFCSVTARRVPFVTGIYGDRKMLAIVKPSIVYAFFLRLSSLIPKEYEAYSNAALENTKVSLGGINVVASTLKRREITDHAAVRADADETIPPTPNRVEDPQ